MNWQAILSTFGLIFLAEMGDKTQLVAISMVTRTKAPWSVLLGASLALSAVSAVGVLGGAVLMRYLPENLLHKGSAALFILIGVLMLVFKE